MSDLPAAQQQRQAFSLAPQNLTEAMKFAEMMAASELVPKAFKGKPGDVLIAVQMGAEVGLAPMGAIQNIAVINGKPGIYGDAGKAILLAAGVIIEEDDIEIVKKNGIARCRITRPGRPPVERTFSIENAQKAGLWNKDGPWKQYPERQMAWRAFWFAARDAAADLLKGLGGAEELVDIEPREINPMPARQTGTQAAEAAKQAALPSPSPERDQLLQKLTEAVTQFGLDVYAEEWSKLTAAQRKLIGADEHSRLKKIGEDAKRQVASADPATGEIPQTTGGDGNE